MSETNRQEHAIDQRRGTERSQKTQADQRAILVQASEFAAEAEVKCSMVTTLAKEIGDDGIVNAAELLQFALCGLARIIDDKIAKQDERNTHA